MELSKEQRIIAAAEKLVRCKGRYHSEQNYRALAALFGVTTPDLPPLEEEQQPVAVVEPSDYVTAAQLVGEGPARKAVHELYEGALRIGDKLYRHPQVCPSKPLTCPKCNGTGMADSGGVRPWGDPISIECDCTVTAMIAAEEQQPVTEVLSSRPGNYTSVIDRALPVGTMLYLLPQQGKAVQVSDLSSLDSLAGDFLQSAVESRGKVSSAYAECAHRLAQAVKDSRSAMLSNEPVSNRDELADEVTEGMQQAKVNLSKWLQEGKQIFDPEYLKDEDGNYPAIPDGYAVVPLKPTPSILKVIEESNQENRGAIATYFRVIRAAQNPGKMSKSEKFDIALSRATESNKDTLAALAKK